MDVANLRPVFHAATSDDPTYRKFWEHWGRLYLREPTEELVRLPDDLGKVWNPKTPTKEKQAVLDSWMAWQPQGFAGIGYAPWKAEWGKSEPSPDPHNLRAALALGVLDQWRRFAVCANTDEETGCRKRYFLKQRKNQLYCSEECAEPSQRKMKRESWKKHGKKWRKKSRSKKVKGQRRRKHRGKESRRSRKSIERKV